LLFTVVWFTVDSSADDVTEASWANQSRAHRDQVIVCCNTGQHFCLSIIVINLLIFLEYLLTQ